MQDEQNLNELLGVTASENPTPTTNPRQARKKDEEEYARRFLSPLKIKDYKPVYIDNRMKEKLQSLIASLQHLAPEITPTMLLSNLLADHIAANKELITRVANEGLKKSLANTFTE